MSETRGSLNIYIYILTYQKEADGTKKLQDFENVLIKTLFKHMQKRLSYTTEDSASSQGFNHPQVQRDN